MKNGNSLILGGIIGLSLVASLTYSFFYKIQPVVDARAYDKIALNLLGGQGFREDQGLDLNFDPAIIRAGPAYEFFLAAIYKIFGHHYEAVWIFQALLHTLTTYLIFLMGKTIFKEHGAPIGLLGAGIFGFHPDLIEISAMLMTETLYLFLVTLVIWVFVKVWENNNSLLAALLGAISGLAILGRPPVILFLLVFLIFFWLRKRWKEIGWFLILLVLVLAPWTIRNYRIYQQFIPTTLIGEYNLWVGNTLNSTGGQISDGYNPALDYVSKNGYLNFKNEARNQFRKFVLEHPLNFLKLLSLRIIRYFSLIRPMGFWFYQHGVSQAIFVASSLFYNIFLFLVGFSGLLFFFKKKERAAYYLATLAMVAPLALLPAVVESRYRFQIYPILAITGSYLLINWFSDKSRVRESLFWVAVSLIGISVLDILVFLPKVLGKLTLISG